VQITSPLLARLALEPHLDEGSAPSGAPLTHAIFAHCAEIEVLTRLPPTLQHLDLRGASLQVPEMAVPRWRPLAGRHLACLCLEGNAMLSSAALMACIGSLPSPGRLRVLDLSGTRADARVFAWLPGAQPGLTHLRVAGCPGLQNAGLAALLKSLPVLEVLDAARCTALERPLAAVVSAASPVAAADGSGPRLRLLGVGQTDFAGQQLEESRRALLAFSRGAHAMQSSLDLFATMSPSSAGAPSPPFAAAPLGFLMSFTRSRAFSR